MRGQFLTDLVVSGVAMTTAVLPVPGNVGTAMAGSASIPVVARGGFMGPAAVSTRPSNGHDARLRLAPTSDSRLFFTASAGCPAVSLSRETCSKAGRMTVLYSVTPEGLRPKALYGYDGDAGVFQRPLVPSADRRNLLTTTTAGGNGCSIEATSRLVVLGFDGSHPRGVTAPRRFRCYWPSDWSVAGRPALVERGADSANALRIDPRTGAQAPITSFGVDSERFAQQPMWIHDGRSVLYKYTPNEAGARTRLVVSRPNGTHRHRLAGTRQLRVQEIAVSPDERRVAVAAYSGRRDGVYLMHVDGTHRSRVASHELVNFGGYGSLRWSNDSKHLLFLGSNAIFRTGRGGHPANKLQRPSVTQAVWSPRATRIAFTDSNGLWTMRPDGTRQHLITATARSVSAWLANPR
jgi:hypothetical protein